MTSSPFATAGATLVANGYAPIPILPDGKAPGLHREGSWYPLPEWSRYCDVPPTPSKVRSWERWPDANVGVALGRGVLAFDIDRDDLVEPIKAVLPPCVVAKRGRKGETLFFRGDTDVIKSRGFKVDGLGVMDLISHGKQTVLPPSIHPNTGEPYRWTTERTLLDTPPAELSSIDESHVEAVIEVLRGIGYMAEDRRRPGAYPTAEGVDLDAERSEASEFFRELNEKALENLGAWVPRLGLQRLQKQGRGFRSVAEWRPSNSGNPLHKRPLLLGIHPKGIIDYGDNDKTYTAINLVIAALSYADWQVEKAAVWLGECLGYDFAPKMVLNRNRKNPHVPPSAEAREQAPGEPEEARQPAPASTTRPTPARAPAAPATDPGDDEDFDTGEGMSAADFAEWQALSKPAVPAVVTARFDPTTGEVFEVAAEPAPERAPLPILPSGLSPEEEMEELANVPGLVGDLVDWFCRTSTTPNRTLGFSAALAFVGTLAGRVYDSPTDLRTNIYTVGLAPSGFGKDHAHRCLDNLKLKANLMDWFGGSDIASASGMRKRVEQKPAIAWFIDEFGQFLRKITDERNSHASDIRKYILEYFERASGIFAGSDMAGEAGQICVEPCVSIYGTATQEQFWRYCRSDAVVDGFLPRFLVFSVGSTLPDEVIPKFSRKDVPDDLVAKCRLVASQKVGGNLSGRTSDGTTKANPLRVPWGAGAEAAFYAARKKYRVLSHEKRGTPEAAIMNRLVEHAQKIAMILAIGIDPAAPILSLDLFERGMRIAEHSVRSIVYEISGRLADNDRQREYIDVRRWIIEAGPDGITLQRLVKRVNGRFDDRRLDDIIKSLVERSKEVASVLKQNPKGGRKSNRFVSTQYLGADAEVE